MMNNQRDPSSANKKNSSSMSNKANEQQAQQQQRRQGRQNQDEGGGGGGGSRTSAPSRALTISNRPANRRLPDPEDEDRREAPEASASSSPSSAALLFVPSTKRQRIRLDSNNMNNVNTNNVNGLLNHPPMNNNRQQPQQYRHQNGQHHQQRKHRQHYYNNQQQRQQKPQQQMQGFRAPRNQQYLGQAQQQQTSSSSSSIVRANNQQQQTNPASQIGADATVRSAELSDLPGYSYDPATKKYYKILDDKPGQPSGSTLRHLRNLAVDTNAMLESHRGRPGQQQKSAANQLMPLPNLLAQMQIHGGGQGTQLNALRTIEESRLRSVDKTMPSYRIEVIDNWSQRFDSCQFLDVAEDGKTLLGCWSTERHDIFSAQCSRILSFNVNIDKKRAKRDVQLADENPQHPKLYDSNGRYACNTYGLQFDPLDNGICLETSNQVLVDMALAPADRDVTCLLFATAGSYYKQSAVDGCPKIFTKCIVHLRPIEFNLSEEGRESMTSPIYNSEWTFSEEPIWSLSFNSHQMKICVGMEKNARILDILEGKNFLVSSGSRNVISSAFVKDGSLLFLGRKNGNISLLDLRMTSNHCVGELPGSVSTSFMHLFRDRPNTLLSENFEGKIKLWDIRMRREQCEMQPGHRNSANKLPCFVDANERFVFAVGQDSIVRGWSLHTGELLCSVNSPRAHIQQKAQSQQQRRGNGGGGGGMEQQQQQSAGIEFPRVVYSSSWGGRAGNSALVFAVNGDLLVHELLL